MSGIKWIGLLALGLLLCIKLNAQYIALPDTNFANWLDTTGFGGCIHNHQLDTTCPEVLNAKSITLSYLNIHDVTGIQYFKNIDTLELWALQLTHLPGLNNNLKSLTCYGMGIDSLPVLPDSLIILNCFLLPLRQLPSLPNSLRLLNCASNQLTELPVLPNNIGS